ncbi:putative methionine-R-sulfoxide reductase with GAF domain [Catalinimonas alkaloidigena]|uniref:GAF domain-containing protein n=1 Tax=Catalinimonas alkaloidigena TaxID=1075417 RepID=UPI002406FD25|nr:GAF domain-containing protein [Catalinimonas alkaloidigena]MDF9797815.1 putative methionine-R-sulfoxide reductase with GAF domain [Catalinimonas alkaloidigena]
MRLNKLSISLQLKIAFGTLLLFSTFTAVWSFFSLDKMNELDRKQLQLIEVQSSFRQIRNYEKDFLGNELINENFYKNRHSLFLDSISIQLLRIKKQLPSLLSVDEGSDDLSQIHHQLTLYERQFDELSNQCLLRGFKDYGLVGSLRELIHKVEDYPYPYEHADMLMLRRHEKDFLLRKDTKYQQKFNDQLHKFTAGIESHTPTTAQLEILSYLRDYGRLFNTLVSMEIQIGLQSDQAMLGQLQNTAQTIENIIFNIKERIGRQITEEKAFRMRFLAILLGVQLIVGLFMLVILSRNASRLSTNFTQIKDKISRLSQGIIPEAFAEDILDEVGQTKNAINQLILGMHQYTEYAGKIGEGHLETGFQLLSAQDRLGNALLEMREKLFRMVKEQNQRSWSNEGIAQMEGMLRKFEDQEDFYAQIISELVTYLNINQGGIFVKESDGDETVMVLKGSYAWGRRKFHQDRFFAGEGLIGQVWLEQDTIYLTEIPENFITITSGLGDANPKSLILVPLLYNEEVIGVIELASFREFSAYQIEMVEKAADSIAASIAKVRANAQIRMLYESSQQQAVELRAQEEEVRQNMEELHAIQEAQQRKEEEYVKQIESLKMEKLSRVSSKES